MAKDNVGELVTIVLPVYNVSAYIDACMRSVVSQDYTNLQIILINDGSTDDSLQKCREWEAKDDRIECFTQDNRGLSAARNEGVKKAKGEYVTFIDPDDVVEPDYVSCLYKALAAESADVSVAYLDRSDSNMTFTPKAVPSVSVGGESMDLLCNGIITVNATCKLYKKDLLERTPFIEGLLYEDNVFTFEIIGKCHRVAICNRILYHHVIREGSITQTVSIENFNGWIRAMGLTAEYLGKYYSSDDYRCVARKVINWFGAEYSYREHYKKMMSCQERSDFEDMQRQLRNEILHASSPAVVSKFASAAKVKLFIMKYARGVCRPFYNVYQTIRDKRIR